MNRTPIEKIITDWPADIEADLALAIRNLTYDKMTARAMLEDVEIDVKERGTVEQALASFSEWYGEVISVVARIRLPEESGLNKVVTSLFGDHALVSVSGCLLLPLESYMIGELYESEGEAFADAAFYVPLRKGGAIEWRFSDPSSIPVRWQEIVERSTLTVEQMEASGQAERIGEDDSR